MQPPLALAPDPVVLSRLTLMLVEVAAGARSPRLAEPSVSRPVLLALTRRRQGVRAVPRLVSWRMQQVRPGVVEATAVMAASGAHHAVALRFEAYRSRWMCTALETTLPFVGSYANRPQILRKIHVSASG
jgi:hypothetical protein